MKGFSCRLEKGRYVISYTPSSALENGNVDGRAKHKTGRDIPADEPE
jgi:hypothetical protein